MKIEMEEYYANNKTVITITIDHSELGDYCMSDYADMITEEQRYGIIEDAVICSMGLKRMR